MNGMEPTTGHAPRTNDSNHMDVVKFHIQFGIGYNGPPRLLPRDLLDFRLKFLEEELTEFEEASIDGNLVKSFDALLDLSYVTLGTAYLMGLPWQQGWDAVQAANMRKVKGASDGSNSTRRSGYDVVKPPGWVAPEATLAQLLGVSDGSRS